MARKKQSLKTQVQKRYKDLTKGILVQAAREVSSIGAYAARDLSGQPHDRKQKCALKKGWFE